MDFREVGFTDDAINFPLSPGAACIVAEHNGIPPHLMPTEFWFAPNEYMRDWLEWLAVQKATGQPYKDGKSWKSYLD